LNCRIGFNAHREECVLDLMHIEKNVGEVLLKWLDALK